MRRSISFGLPLIASPCAHLRDSLGAFSIALAALAIGPNAAMAGTLAVLETIPAANSLAPTSTPISLRFDRPLQIASIDSESFRVFGKWSGAAAGTIEFSDGNHRLTFHPDDPFSAGEYVFINLSHDIVATDASPLRSAGYAFSFRTEAEPAERSFTEIGVMSNRTDGPTRLYGASGADLNEDGFLDLTTVNEVSADVRVFLNLGDGTGTFSDFLEPQPIGIQASPNESADFDNDGHSDLCVVAATSASVWILLGSGDGTFGSIQEVDVGSDPHGIATLDVDGDGDLDIVSSNKNTSNLSLLINDGNGVFGSPIFFEGGISGEWALASGDTNRDGVMDLVVVSRDGQRIRTLLGNGDGTFTFAGVAQVTGGFSWTVILGDVNGDEVLDASIANSASNNAAIMLGLGNGTCGAVQTTPTGGHTPSSDLGDLDGDGDLDWILSMYGGGYWRVYTNNGAGSFTFDQQFNAPASPSCALPFDFDNDGDLDLALFDEVADVVILLRNEQDAAEAPDLVATMSSSIVPNPVCADARIRFSLPLASDLRLEIFDSNGRQAFVRLSCQAAGPGEIALGGKDLATLPSGMYLYRLTASDRRSEGRFLLTR